MLNVFMLRHGETAWNADGNRYCGRTDLPLTEKGIMQATTVARYLTDTKFDAVYASPLQRASRTAEIASWQKPVCDERLIEADFGGWEGKSKEVFIPENPVLWENWMKDPSTARAGGTGETGLEILSRVNDFFESIIKKHSSGRIMVVAHNGVNRFYLAHKLGMQLRHYRKLTLENSTITEFELDEEGELTLLRMNSK